MKYFTVLFFICLAQVYGQNYKYKVKNKDFNCDNKIVSNLQIAIARELNMTLNDVEVSCNGLWNN